MKKAIILLGTFLFSGASAYSQGIKIISNEQLPLPKNEYGYNPAMSPSGDYIIITESDLKGLSKYDLAAKQLSTLTTDNGAGFDVQISEDGNFVAYRSSQYKNKLRYTSLKVLNMATGLQSEIVTDSRDLEKIAIKDGTALVVEKGALKTKKLAGKTFASAPVISSIAKGQLYVTKDRKTKLVSPAGTGLSYLWTSVSPDGKKLLYYVIEHGKAYVSNLDGTHPVSLGVLRAPKWMGNNWVIGMEDYDNGETLTASKIVAVAANGAHRTELTDSSVIATNPSASADATKIVYNTADGKIFLMKIETLK
jgi:Tol biopolymer transport system component